MKQKVRITQGNYKKKIIYYGIDDGGTLKLDSAEELSNCEEDNESVITNSSDAPSDIHSSNFEESSSLTLLVGDVVWSKCSGHNWWPSMIAYEPNSAIYFQTSAKCNNTPQKYHVQFFGDKALRGWVTKSSIIRFQGLQHFLSITNCNFSSSNQKELWDSAVRGAEEAILFSRKERKLAFLFDYQKKGPSVKKQKSQKKSSASKAKVASANPATRRSSRLQTSVQKEDIKPHIIDSTCKPHSTHQSSHTSATNVEKNTIDEEGEKDPYISHTNKKSLINSVKFLRSSSVLQDITCVENHLQADTAPLNIENNCDSGIEDSEAFESPCDDMDLLGARRKRKPKVFEDFHTGDEISDAFKTKAKVKTDDTKANEEEVDKLDKENVSHDDVNDISVKTSTCSNPNKNSKSNQNMDENPTSDLHDNTGKKEIDDSYTGINGKRKRGYKKCDGDEAPSASKKTKSLSSVPNGSKKVAYTKVKSCSSSVSNINGVISNGDAKHTDNKKDVQDCIKGLQKDNTSIEMNKLKRDIKDQYCSMCEELTGDLLSCSGTCLNMFHPNCLGLNFMPTSDFVCDECTTGCHTCFVCHKVGDIRKCSLNTCGKYYHSECLENNDCTKFENKVKDKFTCPHHVCRYCNKNKSLKMTNGKRMVKCIRCPTTYHLDHCMPAGCMVFTPNHIVCDEHFERPSKSTTLTQINTTWCVVCSFGGALVCCDTCPASFHPDCSEDLEGVPEGAWQCRDCRDGKKLRYGDIVWIKFSIYRWWPGKICLPEDVPVRIQNLPHAVGEFPVLFFGSHDYAWLSSRRVFKYADGDMGLSNTKSYLEKYFLKALQEAKEAFQEIEKKREEHIQAFDKKQSNKPPFYGHAKVNKPVSCIQTILDRSEWPICQCKADDPCEKECLNKMLFYECNTSQCPNRENCKNQRMQKLQYAATKMFKCEEKGWGLKADQEIKTGQFVIEYVGELIDEATCRIRIKQYHERDIYDYYFLTIDKDNIIDAYPRGNKSRFMNHSCDPNCETQKWTVNGEVRVGLFATRDIVVGEELSFNYNLDCLGNEKKKCKCGSANCSGYLGVRPKTQHSISIAEKIKKSKDGTKDKPKLKKKKKMKIVHDDECFSCGDGGELLCCDRKNCTKAYHQDCLIMEQAPKGKWQCPWHFCDECGKLARSMCSLCPNSFCESHLDDQMIELMDDVIVCPAHDEEEMANLKKEKVKDTTKPEPVSKSPKSKPKKTPKSSTKKAKNLTSKKVSTISKKVKKSKTVVSERQTNGSKTSEPESSDSDIPPAPKFTKVITPAKKTPAKKTKSPKGATPGKKSKPTKVKVAEKKTPKSVAAVDKKKKKDGKTALKKVHGSKKTEKPNPKKNGVGEKRKHLMKATQKVKDMKRKKKMEEELSENSDSKSSEELVDDTNVSSKIDSIETSILGDTFGDVDIIQRELKKLSNEEKKAAKEQKKVGKAKKRFSFPKT